MIAINSTKNMGTHVTNANALPLPEGIKCAKASMLLQGEVQDGLCAHRTLDLASSLEASSVVNRTSGDASTNTSSLRSVLTITFQFPYEIHLQDSVVTMARPYLRSVISSVQRVATAISPSRLGSHMGPKLPLGSPEALTLAH